MVKCFCQNLEAKKPSQWKKGEIICHYEGKLDDWYYHPEGIIIQLGNKLLLNGEELLYEGPWDKGLLGVGRDYWFLNYTYFGGLVIRRGNKLLVNGQKLIYEGDFNDWRIIPNGVVIERDGKLLLNGKKLLYKKKRFFSKTTEYIDWEAHPEGVIIQDYGSFGNFVGSTMVADALALEYPYTPVTKHAKFLVNGKRLVYEGPYHTWLPHPKGIVIELQGKYLINGEELIYDVTDKVHFHIGKYHHNKGILFSEREDEKNITRFFLDGKELIYEGPFDQFKQHPDGLLIKLGSDFFVY